MISEKRCKIGKTEDSVISWVDSFGTVTLSNGRVIDFTKFEWHTSPEDPDMEFSVGVFDENPAQLHMLRRAKMVLQ